MSATRLAVPVTDASGRERTLRLDLSDDGQIVLLPPPGESAKIAPEHIENLITSLRDLRTRAFLAGEGS